VHQRNAPPLAGSSSVQTRGEQPQHGINMQKISPMLADPLLQIGDAAGQLGPLVLQRRDNMWFGHNPYPLEKMRLCSSSWAFLASRSWWRLLHKTATQICSIKRDIPLWAE
jgi:hypothetical protein